MTKHTDFSDFVAAVRAAAQSGERFTDCSIASPRFMTRYPRNHGEDVAPEVYVHSRGGSSASGVSLAYTGEPVPVSRVIDELEAAGCRFNDTPENRSGGYCPMSGE